MMMVSSINLVPVLVAAVAAFIIGFLWHGPLFGKQWLAMMNIPQSEVDAARAKGMGAMAPQMIGALIQQFFIALVMWFLAGSYMLDEPIMAIVLAVILWFGFIAMPMLNSVLWEKRTVKLYMFNIAYHLVSLIAISLIVTLWR
jgi:hypothetical protein